MDTVIVGVGILLVVIVVTTAFAFFVRIPYVPTPRPVVDAMIRGAALQGSERVFDVGAGTAGVLLAAKRAHPHIDITGIELSPFVWLLGKARIRWSGIPCKFLRRNAFTVDVRPADVLFLYLAPSIMRDLEEKFDRELRPGTRVISHAFPFPRRAPQNVIKVPRWRGARTVYVYRW